MLPFLFTFGRWQELVLSGILKFRLDPEWRLEKIEIVEEHKDGDDHVGHHAQKDDEVKDVASSLFSLLLVYFHVGPHYFLKV